MKTLKIVTAFAAIFAVCILTLLGLRLGPGAFAFVLTHDLAVDFGLDPYGALSAGLIATYLVVWWLTRGGFSWRKLLASVFAIPLIFAAFFAAKSFLHSRSGDVPNPDAVHWFAEDGRALLWYAPQPDGTLLFCDHGGSHYLTGQELKPVTADVYQTWIRLKGKEAKKNAENSAIQQLTRQAFEKEKLEQGWAAQLKAADDKLAHEKADRAKSEKELQEQLKETRNQTAEVQRGVGDVGSQLEKLADQTRKAEESRRGLEIQLSALNEVQKQLGKVSNSSMSSASATASNPQLAPPKIEHGELSRNQVSHPNSENHSTCSTVTVRVQNATRFKMFVKFYSSNPAGYTWPGVNLAWPVEAGQIIVLPLVGFSGEKVFDLAWASENPNIKWGHFISGANGDVEPLAIFGNGDAPLLVLVEHR